jgi:hypothetical protein
LRSTQFWSKVRARREANEEAIRITQVIGPLAHRSEYEARGQAAALALTRADFERARLDYLAWLKERYGGKAAYFWSELADAKRKAYSRRTARFPHVPAEYDRDTMRGEAAIPSPLIIGSWDEQNGFDLGDDNDTKGFGVIAQPTTGIAREEWDGFEVSHHPMPTIVPADQRLCARILDKSPGRNRGRPPINLRAMTDAERKRRQRAKEPV